jgi:hypothetical protein
MATTKQKDKGGTKIETGMPELTGINVIPENATIENTPRAGYKFRYTTGPFLLPKNAGSLDWILLNNDTTVQKACVTVYKCPVNAVKTPVAPGPLVLVIDPKKAYHNANTYTVGFPYEIVLECNSQLLFPYVSVWPANFGEIIPGTGINSGVFLKQMP